MTGLPPLGSDYYKQFGPGSETARQDYNSFMADKDAEVQKLIQFLGLPEPASQVSNNLPQHPQAMPADQRLSQPDFGNGPQSMASRFLSPFFLASPDGINQDRENLIAQAKFWGIQSPEYIPDSVLQNMIQAHRTNAVRPDDIGWGKWLAASAEELGLGAAKGLTGFVEGIPFVGQDVARLVDADKANAWLHGVEEGVQAQLPSQYLTSAKILSGIGTGIAFLAPGTALWKGAEALGKIGAAETMLARMSPVMRAGVTGALATWLGVAGENKPAGTRAKEVAFGAGMSAGFTKYAPSLDQLFNRAASSFASRFTRGLDVDPIELSQLHPEQHVPFTGTDIVPFGNDNLPIQFQGPIPAGPVPENPLIGSPVRGLLGPGSDGNALNPGSYPAAPIPEAPRLGTVTAGGLESVIPPSRQIGPAASQPLGRVMQNFSNDLTSSNIYFGNVESQRPVQLPMALSGSRVANVDGTPKLVYHGTPAAFDAYSADLMDSDGLYGPGIYHTEDPEIAGLYTSTPDVDKYGQLLMQQSHLQQELAKVQAGGTPDPDYFFPALLQASPQDQIEMIQSDLAATEDAMNEVAFTKPNIRPAYLDIKNPFNIDKSYSIQEIEPFANDLKDPHRQEVFKERIDQFSEGKSLYGQSVYQLLTALTEDKGVVNQILENHGYDGITHLGGQILGNKDHQVWIAFHPDQVHSPWATEIIGESEAPGQAATLTKQASIVESPILDQQAGNASFSNADVARAQYAQNPAGISVIKDVGNLAETVRDLTVARQGEPLNYRFVQRDGRTDLVVGNHPGMYDLAGEYQQYGHFTGQLVSTPSGKQLVVRKPGNGIVELENPYHPGLRYRVKASNLQPSRYSHPSSTDYSNPVYNAPKMYDDFRNYVQQYMAEESQKAGITNVPDWLDAATSKVLPERLDSFFKANEITSPVQQGVLESYFNARRVQDFQALAPKEYADAVNAAQEASDAWHEAEMHNDGPSLERKAEVKGFNVVREPGSATIHLWDKNSGLKVDFEDQIAADTFLQHFDRELPDMSEGGDVPLEAAPPSAPTSDLEPEVNNVETTTTLGAGKYSNGKNGDAFSDHIPADHPVARRLGLFNDVYGGSSFDDVYGALPPVAPPLGGNGNFPPFEPPPALGTGENDFREPFRSIKAGKLQDILDDFDSFMNQHIKNMRTFFQDLQTRLSDNGVKFGIYDKFDEVMAGFNRRDAAMRPWMQEAAAIHKKIRAKYLRNGIFDYVYRIEDPAQRALEAAKYGFTKGEIEALSERADLFRRFDEYALQHGILGNHRDFERYVSDVQLRQGQPGISNPYQDFNGRLNADSKFFADNFKADGVQLRQVDYRWLDSYYFRSAFYHKEVQPAMAEFLKLAEAPGVPTKISTIMTNWADVARQGYSSAPDMAVQGLHSILKHFGLTKDETRAILYKGLTWMHWRYMGFKPDVVFRDAIQPLLAGARGNMKILGDVYRDFLRNASARAAMIQTAIRGGYYSPEMNGLEMPGIAETELRDTYGRDALDGYRRFFRDILQQSSDMLREVVPDRFRNVQGTIYDPTYAYGKLQGLNRIVAGEMARRMAQTATMRLGAANRIIAGLGDEVDRGIFGLSENDANFIANSIREGHSVDLYGKDQAIKDSGLDSFSPAVKDKFWQLAQSGRFTDAELYAGREMAQESQNVYGIKQAPMGNRSLGSRFLWMFGSFPSQFFGTFMRNSLRYGSAQSRVATMLKIGTITAGLEALDAKTHWNFSKWVWARSFGWAGGPAFQEAINIAQGIQGKISDASGQYVSDPQKASEDVLNQQLQHPIANVIGSINPVYGIFRLGSELQNDVQNAPNPIEALGRTFLTGQQGPAVDFQQMLDIQGSDMMQEYLQQRQNPQPSPTRQLSPSQYLLAPSALHPGNAAQ